MDLIQFQKARIFWSIHPLHNVNPLLFIIFKIFLFIIYNRHCKMNLSSPLQLVLILFNLKIG